mgnify:CR=1 FL=1
MLKVLLMLQRVLKEMVKLMMQQLKIAFLMMKLRDRVLSVSAGGWLTLAVHSN